MPLRLITLTAALLAGAGFAAAQQQPQAPKQQPPEQQAPQAQEAPKDFSAAERTLLMSNQLAGIKPPATVRYSFKKTGSLEAGFDDQVILVLKADANGRCCTANTQFLTTKQPLELPDVPSAEGNPVILHFLEREVREMNRLTKGSQTHFRKRIRMALYNAATVTPVTLRYRGKEIAGQEIKLSPFLDDPNRPRYENLAQKEYRFLLSEAVPGGLYAIRSAVAAADPTAAPVLAEELTIDGAETPSSSPAKK
jgi:hypothetical protein